MSIIRSIFLLFFGCFSISLYAQSKHKRKAIPEILQVLQANPDAGQWKLKDSVALQFTTHHTQGMLKIGDYFYLTAVEVRTWPRSYGKIINGYDRDTGDGSGHLFKFDINGHLVSKVSLGEGDVYHPGGIDYDGKHIWIPVCEYRPRGKASIYQVDPNTMNVKKMAAIDDAIGAVAYNRDANELVGMNWDSEIFYRWKWDSKKSTLSLIDSQKNNHHFIRYQDCFFIGNDIMLCSGLRAYPTGNKQRYRLGGLQAIRLSDYSSLWETPVPLWTGKNTPLNNNPFYAERTKDGLLLYFIPEDDHSQMYIYEIENKGLQ